MTRRTHHRHAPTTVIPLAILDSLWVAAAWILAYHLRFSTDWIAAPKGIPSPWLYYRLLPFVGAIWMAVMLSTGFYRRTGRHRSPLVEGLDIIHGSILATLVFVAFTYFYAEYRYSRITLVIFAALHPPLLILGRSLARKVRRAYRRSLAPRRILAMGSPDALARNRHVLESLWLPPDRITDILLLDPKNTKSLDSPQDLKSRGFEGITLHAQPENWAIFLSEAAIQSVVLVQDSASSAYLLAHGPAIVDQVPDVRWLLDIRHATRLGANATIVDNLPVITLTDSPLTGFNLIIKQLVDFLGATTMLLIFGIPMLAIALLVRLSSPGPVLFQQERMGVDGKTFKVLKFRTMPVDAEKKTGPVWATAQDSRATGIGRFLRRHSLDELPQIFNILRGEMSLVGPRPERPVFVDEFRRTVPGYMLRHRVKAGLTGWAQVQGWRGDSSLERRIECDLYYIRNWSLWLDLKILIWTAFRGFSGPNAY